MTDDDFESTAVRRPGGVPDRGVTSPLEAHESPYICTVCSHCERSRISLTISLMSFSRRAVSSPLMAIVGNPSIEPTDGAGQLDVENTPLSTSSTSIKFTTTTLQINRRFRVVQRTTRREKGIDAPLTAGYVSRTRRARSGEPLPRRPKRHYSRAVFGGGYRRHRVHVNSRNKERPKKRVGTSSG